MNLRSPRLTGSGTIIVMVDDVNDHTPTFDHGGTYIGHILENSIPNKEVLTITATDRDEGKNAHITIIMNIKTYKMHERQYEFMVLENFQKKLCILKHAFVAISKINKSFVIKNEFHVLKFKRYILEGSDRFQIDSNTGVISSKVSLDREEQDHYDLVVIAKDNGAIPKSASSLVRITVDDINDNVPKFERQSYNRTIYNQDQSGSFVIGVTALDKDIGDNGLVVYSLSGSGCSQFNIDQSTGIVTRETTLVSSRYTCNIQVVDKGTPQKTSFATLTVELATTNLGNKPVFSNIGTNIKVVENEELAHIVTTVTASAPSQSVRYYIAGGNIGHAFSIDQISGDIKVNNLIDYEMTQVFHLWIEARVGSSQELSTFAKVVISVVDQNDNTPRFSQPIYKESIQEEVIGATLVQVQATDPDGGQNGNIIYKLVSGNVNNILKIIQNGQQPNTGTTTVRVSVLDINDNPPKFSRQFYVEINEDIDIGSFVIQVVSSDPDIGDNARVTYSLPENANGRFAIDAQSGNITVISQLDTETMVNSSSGNKYYQLVVKATDSAFSVTKKVLVFVKDVNDNSPQFVRPFIFDFPERLPAGSFVGKVSARDADFTNNQVYFSLKIPSTEFKLNPDNGTITSLVELVYTHDIESLNTVNRKEIVVIATDYGTPPKSSEAVIKINILDANDHAPIFEKDSYFSAVPENANLGDFILNVSAKDNLDFGINAEIEYAIVGGNGTGFFLIDKVKGEITLASSVQGRQNSDYILNVQARDKGTPPQKTIVTVKLTITDVNLHAPRFVSVIFYATVPEDAGVGYTVASIKAIDDDMSGPNGRVKFFIMAGNANGLFQIDEERGFLTVQNKLDFDTVPVHHLNITVRDQGLLFKQVSAIFTVQLTDVNDNDPVFNKTEFTAFVPENSPRGHIVTQITATDKDIGENAVIIYSLIDSIANSKFNIDQNTGIIRTQGELDYEQKELYSLTIMAVNRGSTKKSTTNVIIHLTGVNEFYPEFVQHQYSFVINESAANGDLVGTVMATDQDHGEDGKVYYYLIGASNLKGFKIYPTSGQIVVAGKPDYESSPQIILNVMAKNWGSVKGNDTDQCQVRISIQDANDAPVFSQVEYNAYVLEGSGRGVSVIQVTATDNDHRPQDKQFSYSILGGDSDYMFQIDAKSGLVTTTGVGTLDRESTAIYNITVAAIDTGTPSETGSAVVRIHLQDVNDNSPFFVPRDLIGYVKENQPIGTTVMKLSDFTFDLDLPPNRGPYTYTTLPGNHNSFFSIIGSEGIVKTQVSIDREVKPEFTVPVIVTDNGNPPLSSSLSFRVIVQDINDSPPTGAPITVMTSIFSNQYFQGVIADVRPLDQDIVGNYSCSIVEGNQQKFDIISGCQLQLKQPPQDTQYVLRVSGSDGLASVNYLVSVKFRAIDNNTLKDTVILRVKNISPSQFMKSKYKNFLDEITSLFSAGQKVIIYNIQELGSDILVYTAVEQSGGGYVLYDILKREILTNKPTLQINIDIVIADVGYSVCSPSLCGQGECLNQVSVGKTFHYVDSPTLVITSPQLTLDYQCKCPPEASGKHCENIVNPCGQGYCQNGGQCVNTICKCPSGWTGQYCESDINECAQSPCQNLGTCENLHGTYTCNCREGFTGKNCEIGSDNCAAKPCSNDGKCHNEVGGFRCECDFRYWGPTCQFSSIGFNEGSYMEFAPMAEYDNVIDVTFSTIKENSLLLYNPSAIADSSEFISLEIVKGNIRFSYKLDYSQTTRLTVPKSVTSGNWFRVQVHRNRKTT
ncbi:hypothetical protein KUTeg_024651 [Tegillarca granosa]|uniref:Uncharacterized protein n=1 Tax=Tegillarca granosa TaxID=220873 RepID=A0ABQ9E3P2_TEGGR|nr:hypothetical protein KUTeg_024651 [Tegillarca granosa]